MSRLFRLLRILRIALRFRLDEFVWADRPDTAMARAFNALLPARDLALPRAARLRLALESLGPIFVKFGQLLSTRRDLLPQDLADELARLQDRVPPFPGEQARAEVERSLGRPIGEIFESFDLEPVASASVAQVHFAMLPAGTSDHAAKDGGPAGATHREVAVKILRPGIAPVIARDLALMSSAAWLVERVFADGPRLRPREVVQEFAHHLEDELDLMREAGNASQLRRNFEDSPLLAVPRIHWDWCAKTVMTMERMHGVPISRVDELRAAGVDIPALARAGVEIFFTQVFRDGYFHADMHPGNIFVSTDAASMGRYIALDFGIMGSLNEPDKDYLARNFLAFFNRDYRRVAEVHIESGWVPAGTRVDELESAIRSVCEPIFNRPLKEIQFGVALLRLFQVSRRFDVHIQPQLVMLQKTLLNIEGLGRDLDPDLDLWQTAKPYLERWMNERVGFAAMLRSAKREVPYWAGILPQLPRLVHRALAEDRGAALERMAGELLGQMRARNALLAGLLAVAAAALATWLVRG